MNQDNPNAILSIDLCIRLRGSVYRLSTDKVLKWLIPLAAILIRAFLHRRDGP